MPCIISLNQPLPLDFKCQFDFKEAELIDFIGNKWCLFHLPYERHGIRSEKATWSEEKVKDFSDQINDIKINPYQKSIDFKYVIFPAINFESHFNSMEIDFSYAIFQQDINFQKFNFQKTIKFHYTIFNRPMKFNNSIIHRDVDFTGARFKEIAEFQSTVFKGAAIFCNARFHGSANFQNSAFNKRINFSNAIFSKKANFSLFEKQKLSQIDNEYFHDEVDFKYSSFEKDVIFTNRNFSAKTDFSNCSFAIAPDFHNCKLHQDTTFPKQKAFKDTKTEGAAKAYRTLALAMANVKARREEAMFYALEQKSLRSKLNLTEKILSYLYDWISAYGQSIGRVFGWFAGVTVIFCMIYAIISLPFVNIHSSIDWKILQQSITFTMQQIVRPFNIWSDSASIPIFLNNFPLFYLRLIATLQTLISLILITLFIFTIRWRFKRE